MLMRKVGTKKELLFYFLWVGLLQLLFCYAHPFCLTTLNITVKTWLLMKVVPIKIVNYIYAKTKNSIEIREDYMSVYQRMINTSHFLITQIFIAKKKLYLLLFQVSHTLDLFLDFPFSLLFLIIKEECLLTLLLGSLQLLVLLQWL